MQYILTEKEYLELIDFKERFENAQSWIHHKNGIIDDLDAKIKHLEADNINAHNRIKYLSDRVTNLKASVASDNKALAAKAHELLCKEAELANLSSALREAKRDCEGTAQELKAARAERDAEKVFRQDVQEELSRCQQTSRKRLECMEHLQKAVLDLKHEQVCIATNPRTGTVKVVSIVKADTYRKFGWTVSEVGLVDRPA